MPAQLDRRRDPAEAGTDDQHPPAAGRCAWCVWICLVYDHPAPVARLTFASSQNARERLRPASASIGRVTEYRRDDGYVISTDRSRIDRELIWGFLRTTYWWPHDADFAVVDRAIDNSLCFGLLCPAGNQAGFARAVTDRARFAWLADVFVLEPHRGRGLGIWLVQTIVEHPELRTLRLMLGTADAHGLYERFGFAEVDPSRLMQRRGA
jgi:GNAT superfamily N-acetyltransferase